MPEEEKKMVDIDTSGPDASIDIEETKDESVVDTEAPKQETETIEKETDKTFEKSDHFIGRNLSCLIKLSWTEAEVKQRAQTMAKLIREVIA